MQSLHSRCHRAPTQMRAHRTLPALRCRANMKGLIFGVDGVLLESSDLHLKSYNQAFKHFNVKDEYGYTLTWVESEWADMVASAEQGLSVLYSYFRQNGWPTSDIQGGKEPETKEEREQFADTLEAWRQLAFVKLVQEEEVEPRPGVLRLIDEAREQGIKMAVCSTSDVSVVKPVVESVLGAERCKDLAVITAGNNSSERVTQSAAFKNTADALGLAPGECVAIEHDKFGAHAIMKAGMRCVVTYTQYTREHTFAGAERIVQGLGFPASITIKELRDKRIAQDDRVDFDVTDSAVWMSKKW